VALSASSPFWRGEPTGFASCRHLIFAAFPRSGPPPQFASFEEYARVVETLVAAGCIEDYTRTWWDVRPHPRFGTVEVRVMDAVSRVEDAVAVTAYVQALVRRYALSGERPVCHPAIAHENKWRAARYGLDAVVADPRAGGPLPLRAVVERTLSELAPHAAALDCAAELDGVARILRAGNGAERQTHAHARGGVDAVAALIAAVTRGSADPEPAIA
jgi:carboxylate-amine ligase